MASATCIPWNRIHDFLLEVGAERSQECLCLQALIKIQSLVPYDSGVLFLMNEAGAVTSYFTQGVEHRWCQAFIEHYCQVDGGFFAIKNTPTGEVCWNDYRRSEFVNGFIRPQGFRYTANIRFHDTASRIRGIILFNRSKTTAWYSARETALLNIIRPHLANLHSNFFSSCHDSGSGRFRLSGTENDDYQFLFRELTAREAEITALLCKGLNTGAISSLLVISPRTAQKHIENIFDKLGVRSRQELLVRAFERLKT